MSHEFARSLRSLNQDGFGRSIAGIAVAALLVGAWLFWFLTVPVARYEVSDRARLEVDESIYAIQAPVAGRIAGTNLALGREVEAGDLLIDLETDAQQLQMREEESRVAAIEPQLSSLRAQIAAEEQASRTEKDGAAAALEQFRAQIREADAQRAFAEQEFDRIGRLRGGGLVSERDLQRAGADARSRRAAGEALVSATTRLELDQRKAQSEREVVIARLRGEITQLEGVRITAVKSIERTRFEIARRRIVAPAAGRLGQVAVLRVGGWVDAGATLGAIVPRGRLRIVAEYTPPAVFGRIAPGQSASMRLDGFPWTQYGAIPATVQQVGNEVRDGRVRVELLVQEHAGSSVPMQHGLPGVVEVQIETVTPAILALRTAGRILARPGQPSR